MSQSQSSLSLHETVREEIRSRIAAGTYAPESPIPSTAMLSEEFGVSTITVKRALRDLQAAGAIVSTPGKGTYVKRQRRLLRQLDVKQPFLDEASIRPVSVTREKILDPTMASIEPPTHAMLCVRKTIWSDDAPLVYDTTYVSTDMGDQIVEEFAGHFVVDVLEKHGIHVVKTHIVIDAAPAAGMVEEIFGIPNGYPTLRRLYKMVTSDPNVTVYGVLQAPFDRLACKIDFDWTSGKNSALPRGRRRK
ncbi:GntR family transcriptional regulator [Paraburkholderia steynii]|uniref:GntR family transcriptional regulator n=1 Tax=Paraburkholderia steynii TaxID=1245441 RepID=A0A4R0XBK8_9BURK|nr:GntR family transcriptional regulator [Paraburkholderia steynii]